MRLPTEKSYDTDIAAFFVLGLAVGSICTAALIGLVMVFL